MLTQYPVVNTRLLKPGQMRRFVINEQPILLANVDGTYYAIEDLCSHDDAVLTRGALRGNCVECPLHGSQFDLKTGQPRQEPATEPVKTYALEIKRDTIYITLGQSD